MKKYRLIVIWTPVIIFLLEQAFLLKPAFFYSALSLSLLLIVFSVKILLGRSRPGDWPLFILPPALFFCSFSLYATIISGIFWIQLMLIISAIFIFLYLRNLYYRFSAPSSRLEEKDIDNLLAVGSWLSFFAAAGFLYGLPAFVDLPFWLLGLIFVPVIFLLFIQFLPFKNIAWPESNIFVLVSVLVLAEMTGIISLLPLNFTILGILLALVYYLLLAAGQLYWRRRLTRQSLKWPLIMSIFLALLLLLSARWLP